MSTEDWREVALKIEDIFNSKTAKSEMGQRKSEYMLKVLSATKALYLNINHPMKLPESYYIGNVTMQHHGQLIEALEEAEGFVRSDDGRVKDYGMMARSFKVMICEEGFDQEFDHILSELRTDILQICEKFESSV